MIELKELPPSTAILPPSPLVEIAPPPASVYPPSSAQVPLLDTYKQVAKSVETDESGNGEKTLQQREKRKKQAVRLSYRIASFDERRAVRMEGCSSYLVRRTCCSCGKEKYHADRCGDRFCPTCARIRSARLARRYGAGIAEYSVGRHGYLVTLTYRNAATLPDRKRIAADVRNLMRSAFWKPYGGVEGGLYSVELTYNRKTDTWHPHVHALLFTRGELPCFTDAGGVVRWDVRMVNQPVSDLWRGITGGSFIVNGKPFNGNVEEVVKYITKLDELVSMPEHRLAELCAWTKGRRMVSLFGGLYRMKLDENEDEDEAGRDAPCDCGCTVHEELCMEYDHRLRRYVPVSCNLVDCGAGECSVEATGSPP